MHRRCPLVCLFCVFVLTAIAAAQQFSPNMYGEVQWRMIGPFRGGRTRAVAGVPGQPNLFYIGAVNGGVWKTTDYGHTWAPIFDDQPSGSIGAIAVAPSDPNVIYVGSGEGMHRPDLSTGDGIYRSNDAGKTWTHLGLRDGQQIPDIAVDPRDPNRLLVAVLGHPYGPNAERGIFRSTDGGKTFQKVLYRDENTGGSFVQIDPANPDVVYAGLWEAREGPWENAAWSGTGGGLFKSTDGGSTWRQLTKGLPAIVQVNLGIAPSQPKRLYAEVAHDETINIYRSDDAGENWSQVTDDPRPATRVGGGGELPVVKVDPRNQEIVYVASIVTWKSTDGGKTWTGIRGAPGGDDYQNIWINPLNPDIILMASDQGAIITVNGGQSWSSWYTQPTAQLYHVGVDNSFPYRLCSGQQESGSVCIASRGNDGEITARDWRPVAAEEYGFATPDPADPNVVYGGKLTRFDWRTTQAQDILPKPLRGKGFRVLRTEPVVFSPHDPQTLYFAANTLWRTQDAGHSWQQISPDLTREKWEAPESIGKYRTEKSANPTQRGVIYAVAPSPLDAGMIWAGTDDGLIHVTTDGGTHWSNVTPPQMAPWAKVSIIDASHFDRQTAYVAVNTFRLDDLRPHILRTHDGGKTWTEIRNGIPDGEAVNVVREDPQRKGMLFAGTERQVYVSWDDGEHWQSLRQNMPATSVRDLLVKDDDLVAATHGRGFWILDDITPLRQLDRSVATADAFLFRPQPALRVRWDTNTDTPLPPDVPAGKNPPDGAIIDYFLKSSTSGQVTLEIIDGAGRLVRRYACDDPVPQIDPMLAIPAYWVRPAKALSGQPGMHRFLWDLHYPPVPGIKPEYPMQAVFRDTAPAPTSPWVLPGQYSVRLTVEGHSYTQPLTVAMDPRIKTPRAGLEQQFALSQQVYQDLIQIAVASSEMKGLHEQLARLQKSATQSAVAESGKTLDEKVTSLMGSETRRRRGSGQPEDNFGQMSASLRLLLDLLQGADTAPTTQGIAAINERHQAVAPLLARWNEMKARDIPQFNERLRQSNLPEINLEVPGNAARE